MKRYTAKKAMALTLTAAMLAAAAACSADKEKDETQTPAAQTEQQSAVLTNHMTDAELARAEQTDFMLLDEPWESAAQTQTQAQPADDYDYLRGIVGYEVWQPEDYLAEYEEEQAVFPDEDLQPYIDDVNEHPEDYTDQVQGIIVNGDVLYFLDAPAEYDGGAGCVQVYHYNMEDEMSYPNEIVFDDYDELKALLSDDIDQAVEAGEYSREYADTMYAEAVEFFDALIDGTALPLERGVIRDYAENAQWQEVADDEEIAWQFDAEQVAAISDYITEYHIWDEELDLTYVVHVITPPDYDPSQAYGALVMTDAVWRFGDVVTLRGEMENGRATEDKLLVTIGLDYALNNWDNDVRSDIFCVRKAAFLDFITDNLMPYLSGLYNIDCTRSCLFGHSQGGIFTHYAAFNSDLYENRPFAEYIIGSPAFWTPYFTCLSDWADYQDEYGFFERNDSFSGRLYLTGGDAEDADYLEYFGENDSTLEGLAHLCERLDSHGVDYVYKLYSSNHYMYVSTLLQEYIDGEIG